MEQNADTAQPNQEDKEAATEQEADYWTFGDGKKQEENGKS